MKSDKPQIPSIHRCNHHDVTYLSFVGQIILANEQKTTLRLSVLMAAKDLKERGRTADDVTVWPWLPVNIFWW